MSAFDTQVGGGHYKELAIQPMQYSMANKLDACQHTIIKYVTRFRDKGGLADLQKARHVIDMLIELEMVKKKEEAAPQPDPYKDDTRAPDTLRDELLKALKSRFGGDVEIHFVSEESGEI